MVAKIRWTMACPVARRRDRSPRPQQTPSACVLIFAWRANQRAHLIGAAKGRGPLVFAHIGVLRAAEPDVEGVFDTSHKTPHWGKRRLKSDE